MNKMTFPQSFPTIHTERLILKQATIEDTKGEIKWYDNIFKEFDDVYMYSILKRDYE